MTQTELVVTCHTVGELLDELAKVARDPKTRDLMGASIDGPRGEIFWGFKIVRRILSDKSEILDFQLF